MEYVNGKSEIFETIGHRIEVIEFQVKQPLENGGTVAGSLGWIWKMKKINNKQEHLETFCLLQNPAEEVEFDYDGGEWVDAMEAVSKDWRLHIGTEDAVHLENRARDDDEFPKRLKREGDFISSLIKVQENKVSIKVPPLLKNEILYLQYITAYDKRDDNNFNTWETIDQYKHNLEKWIGLKL